MQERQALADGLARYLAQLGLEGKTQTRTLAQLFAADSDHEPAGQNGASRDETMVSLRLEALTTNDGQFQGDHYIEDPIGNRPGARGGVFNSIFQVASKIPRRRCNENARVSQRMRPTAHEPFHVDRTSAAFVRASERSFLVSNALVELRSGNPKNCGEKVCL